MTALSAGRGRAESMPTWAAVLAVCFGIIPSQALRLSVAPFLLLLKAKFGISDAGAGLLFSVFFVSYALLQIPSGVFTDRYGSRPVALTGILVMVLGTAFFLIAPSYPLALVGRVAMGIGASLIYPALVRLLARSVSEQRRGMAFGFLESAQGTGMLIGLGVMPVLAARAGIYAAVLGTAALFLVPALLLVVYPIREGGGQGTMPALATIGSWLRGGPMALILAIAVLGLFLVNGFLGWFPTYADLVLGRGGISGPEGTLIIAISVVATSMLGGHVADRYGRMTMLYVGGGFMVLGSAALLLPQPTLATVLGAVLMGGAVGFGITSVVLVVSEAFGTERAGMATGLMNAVGQGGSILSGVVYGALLGVNGSFVGVWMFATLVAIARLGLIHIVAKRRFLRPGVGA